MPENNIYTDIAARTGGNIYIGVVGPVRTGKSTFIKNFMESLILPAITDSAVRERARDELPQSGSGRTITTSEPKFIPEEAVELTLAGAKMRLRLADCVGFMVEGALGTEENGVERRVDTPWFDAAVEISRAAEEGTRRVMRDHATVGIVITSDGSVTDLPREAYLPAERTTMDEMKASGKPFVTLVNSRAPEGSAAAEAVRHIRETYGVEALAVDILHLTSDGIAAILRSLLFEFPAQEIAFDLPGYLDALPLDHPVKRELTQTLLSGARAVLRIRDLEALPAALTASGAIERAEITSVDLSCGASRLLLTPPRALFFDLLSEALPEDMKVTSDDDLPRLLTDLAAFKAKYARYLPAVEQALETGYGVIMPNEEELTLAEPEIVRKGGRFGVRLSAKAPSLHLLRADIQSTVCPIVGSEKQSEELIDYILGEFEDDPARLWSSNIFGKSLYELINEGLASKLEHVTGDAGLHFRDTLERVINEGSGGVICIIL